MRAFCLSLTLAIVLCTTTRATVLIPAEFREIVGGSQIIVHGRVTDVRSEWVADRIETFVTIAPATFYRGSPTASITFRTPGGEVGRYKSVMVGAPEFRIGDEAVLFLKTDGSGPRIFGLSQGLFRVRIDPRTGRRLVIRHPLIGKDEAANKVARGDRTRSLPTLDAFGAEVRAAVQQAGLR